MIALLLLAAAELPADFPKGTPTTIEEVRRDPRRWDGQWVQLEGWINRCYSTDCHLAERLAARPINQGMILSFEAQPSFDQWLKPMLPVRARVVARVDAACLADNICLDRAPHLRQMHVEAVQTNLIFPDKD